MNAVKNNNGVVKAFLVASLILLLFLKSAQAKELSYTEMLMEQYAEILLPGLGDKYAEKPLLALLEKAESYRDDNKNDVAAWRLCARIRFAYANTQGMMSFLKIVKKIRKEMEQVALLNSKSGRDLGQSFLGYLYLGMPPWPISFGNKKKGRMLLEEAYLINPESSNSNYFYSYLYIEKKNTNKQKYI